MQLKPVLRLCRVAHRRGFLMGSVLVFMASSPIVKAAAKPAQDFLVEAGKAKAVIVLGDNSDPFYRFVGEELQRYVKAITGASTRDRDGESSGEPAGTSAGADRRTEGQRLWWRRR